jgi:hypothetical protein
MGKTQIIFFVGKAVWSEAVYSRHYGKHSRNIMGIQQKFVITSVIELMVNDLIAIELSRK